METVAWPYLIYAVAAIGLTVGLASTLHRHGKMFLIELVPDNVPMAKAINSMLVTGFFMLNLGYGFLISRIEASATSFEAAESLIQKLGLLLVSLGAIHFANMAVFWRIRRNLTHEASVPMPADVMVPPPPRVDDATFTWAQT